MVAPDATLMTLVRAIIGGDTATASRLLAASQALASVPAEKGATRQAAQEHYLLEIEHYLYAGDTALHIAAAAYRPEIIRLLVANGADVGARNRRGAQPLHYAVDGVPGSRTWNPRAQAETVTCLIEAGADPNASDKSGVTALHRAVRTRCAAAVSALLDGGADVRRTNKGGSTPMRLATWTTGRGGSGSPESKAQQEEIVHLLQRHGASGP
jgi:ankyrin repeat protein